MKAMREFKKHLAEFRESQGMTRGELSSRIGMSRCVVQKIEAGHQNPGYKFLKALNTTYPDINLLEWFGFNLRG